MDDGTRQQDLKIEIKNDVVNISIGTAVLLHVISIGRRYGLEEIEITDKNILIADLIRELMVEEEDGSTLVHTMLDEATTNACENGSSGVRYKDE